MTASLHSKQTQNIFLSGNVVKLGDFGISKILEPSMDLARTVIGTPYYMSPELLKNKPYGYKSDVWSAGCVLYEMMCLKHAFEGKDYLSLVNNILKGQAPPVPAHYSAPLKELLGALLVKSPEARPSVKEVLTFPLLRGFMAEQSRAHRRIERPIGSSSVVPPLQLPQAPQPPKQDPQPQPPPTPSRASALRQRVEEKQIQEAVISPTRLRLMKELEFTRKRKEVLKGRLEKAPNPAEEPPIPVAQTPRKRGSGSLDPSMLAAGLAEEKRSAAKKEGLSPDAVRPPSAAEERKQLLERRWKDFHAASAEKEKEKEKEREREREREKEREKDAKIKDVPKKSHSVMPAIEQSSPVDEAQLKEELSKVEDTEKTIEEKIESLIIEDRERESLDEFNQVMSSFAAHAEAPPCPAGDLEDDDNAEPETGNEAQDEQEPRPPKRSTPIPRLPGALADRVLVLRQHCIDGLGEALFSKAYSYVRSKGIVDEDDRGLLNILGESQASFARALLSLTFTEATLEDEACPL